MSEISSSPQPAQLWKQMSEDQKLRAAEAFWREPDGIEQQVEAMTLLAQKLKARPRYIQGLPIEKRAKHLAHQRPMMSAFLDAVGIAHDNGLITEDPKGPVTPEQVSAGRAALEGAYPAEDIQLYFATLLAQDPETWAVLREPT